MRGLSQDVRDAWRSIAHAPGFAVGVIGSLALGMTAVTAAFSLVNTAALRPPDGIHRPGEVVELRIQRLISGVWQRSSTPDTFSALRGAIASLTDVAAYHSTGLVVGLPGEPDSVPGTLVSPNYFDVLGTRPALGRLIGAADDGPAGTHPVAVLSHAAWVRHFAGDPNIVGTPIKINGRLLEVIGVASPDFTGTRVEIEADSASYVWIPFSMADLVARDAEGNPSSLSDAARFYLQIFGRLKPGATRDRVQAEASVVVARIEQDTSGPKAMALVTDLGERAGDLMELVGFMAVPMIVLALACVNAANLLTSRASRRLREAAVRLSLGATAWRITRQLLVESVMLAIAAAAAGVAITLAVVAVLEHTTPVLLRVDWRVTTFTAAVAVITAFAFGVAPALSAAARAGDLVTGMARKRGSRVRSVLIAAQAALSLALVATGWQFMNTVRANAQSDGLSAPDRLAVASINVGRLPWLAPEVDGYYERVLGRVAQLPGVASVSMSCLCDPWGGWVPASQGGSLRIWLDAGRADAPGSTLAMYARGDLFSALELPIAAGRGFRPDEHTGPLRAVVVNRPFAERHLGPQPVGQSIRIGGPRDTFATARLAVVVGVVQPPPVRRTDALPMVFYPSPLVSLPGRSLYVRFDRPAADSLPLLHAAIRQVHADVPRPQIFTAEQLRYDRNEFRQLMAGGVSLLGIVALALAAGGLYGVVAFVVTMRNHEIAVRMALGASPGVLVRMIVREALTPAAVGAVLGAFGAAAAGMIVRSRLYGAAPVDPVAFTGSLALLMCAMLVASFLPARRASRIDPMMVLRRE